MGTYIFLVKDDDDVVRGVATTLELAERLLVDAPTALRPSAAAAPALGTRVWRGPLVDSEAVAAQQGADAARAYALVDERSRAWQAAALADALVYVASDAKRAYAHERLRAVNLVNLLRYNAPQSVAACAPVADAVRAARDALAAAEAPLRIMVHSDDDNGCSRRQSRSGVRRALAALATARRLVA